LLRLGDAPSNNDFFLKIIYPDWVRFGMLNGSTWKDADATTELANSGWYFISGTFSTSTGQKLYINGNLEGTNSNTTRGTTPYATHFYLASYDGTNTFANGLIDQVRIYNYARTPAQIAWDYNKGKPVAYYDFNECQGTTIHDAGGVDDAKSARNDGTVAIGPLGSQSLAGTCAMGLGSTAAWGVGSTGKYGASLSFDGTDDYVSVVTGSSANSVSFWAKPTSNTASMVQLATGIGVTASSGVITAPGFTSPTIYVNGIPGSTLTADTWQMITVTSATAVNASAIKFGLVGSTYYSGQMDEIKIWNYPLTSVQVKTEFNQGSAVRFED